MANKNRLEHMIVNLGTPTEPTEQAVREFLAEFLGDPMVVEWPAWFWKPILHGIVLRRRPRRIARLYQSIWSDRGAPLRVQTEDLVAELSRLSGDGERVSSAYRYGNPGLDLCVQEAFSRSRKVVFTPLFPQRTASSSETANRVAVRVARRLGREEDLVLAPIAPQDPGYIAALAGRVREALLEFNGEHKPHVLASFHSLPQAVNKREGSVYTKDCEATFQALMRALQWDENEASLAYQSVFGPAKWVGPATSDRIEELARGGTQQLLVVMPGFLCDGLETLEEIGVEGRKTFLDSGGKELRCVPSVSGHPELLKSLVALGR